MKDHFVHRVHSKRFLIGWSGYITGSCTQAFSITSVASGSCCWNTGLCLTRGHPAPFLRGEEGSG